MAIIKSVASLLGCSVALTGAEFHVSPSGTPAGNGSTLAPWDLATALAQPAAVAAGDTIWLHGGTYVISGGLTASLTGSAAAPIRVRQAIGERATLDVGANANNRLFITGSYVRYEGFELTSSTATANSRWSATYPVDFTLPPRGLGIDAGNASGQTQVKIINVVLHDADTAFGFWSGCSDSEIYGCLIYHNGYDAPDRGHTHGIYAQNQTGSKRLAENIIFGQYSHGIHCYGSGAAYLDGLVVEGNMSFDNGYISTISGPSRNILIGGGRVAQNPIVRDNCSYLTNGPGGTALDLGYASGVANATVERNWLATAGGVAFNFSGTYASIADNRAYGLLTGVPTAVASANQWTATRPTGAWIRVRPNAYEAGRANICVYNWDLASQVAVDVSTVLGVGDAYEVRDAQNFYAAPVVTGVYVGGSINLPMTSTTVAAVVGTPALAAVHTASEFTVFVLMRTASGTGGSGGGSGGGGSGGSGGTANSSGGDGSGCGHGHTMALIVALMAILSLHRRTRANEP